VQAELIQTLVTAFLLIGVTLIAGSIGLKRFEAIDRRFEAIDGRFGSIERSIAELRTELRSDIASFRTEMRTDIGELRSEQAQMRSDLTHVALAVGARPSRASERRGTSGV